jgi:hypothetical protein
MGAKGSQSQKRRESPSPGSKYLHWKTERPFVKGVPTRGQYRYEDAPNLGLREKSRSRNRGFENASTDAFSFNSRYLGLKLDGRNQNIFYLKIPPYFLLLEVI